MAMRLAMRPAAGVALGACVAAALAPLYTDGGAARPADWWWWAVTPSVVLAGLVLAAVLAVRSRRRALLAIATGLAAVLAGWAIWLSVLDLRSGAPGGVLTVLAGCAVVAAAALAVTVIRPAAPPGHPILAAAALPVCTTLVTVTGLLLAPVFGALPEHSVTATTTAVPGAPPAPTHQAWQVSTPRAASTFGLGHAGVVPAGAGLVTAVGYPGAPSPGLAGVDGVTGKLRWTYDRGPATPSALTASPDGAYVVAVFDPRTGDRASGSLLVALDAMSGRPLWSRVVSSKVDLSSLAPSDATLTLFADQVLPAGDPDTLLGLDLATGAERWQVRPPAGCRWSFLLAAATADAPLQSERCDDGAVRLVALDQATGGERWNYSSQGQDRSGEWANQDDVTTDPGGTLVLLRREIGEKTSTMLLAGDTGDLVQADPDPRRSVLLGGPLGVLAGGGIPARLVSATSTALAGVTVPTDDCPAVDLAASTPTVAALVCGEPGGGRFLLIWRAGHATPDRVALTTTPGRLRMVPGALLAIRYSLDSMTYTGYR